MTRQLLQASVAFLLCTVFATTAKAEFSIVSNSSTITTPGASFDFDFHGQQAMVQNNHNLVGIRVDYMMNLPVIPGTSNLDLGAKLLLPTDADYKLGFDVTTNLSDGSMSTYTDHGTSSPSGFVFSGAVKDLLKPNGHISGMLQASGVNLEKLNEMFGFFAGPQPTGFVSGSITAFMTLRFAGQAGGAVPEPCSTAVWGLISSLLAGVRFINRRRIPGTGDAPTM